MVKKKKRKYKLSEFKNQYKDIVKQHKNELPTFNYTDNYTYSQLDLNSWFKNYQYTTNNITITNISPYINELDDVSYKSVKIKMKLTDIHKQIFQQWFKASTYMYNETLNYIRTNYEFTKKTIIRQTLTTGIKQDNTFYDKYYIRTKMNKLRNIIQNKFMFTIDKKYTLNNKPIKCKIDAHTLDKTIFQLVQNIRSAKTCLLKGYIKRFRLKFWKYNRPSQIIEFEKRLFKNGILIKKIFNNLSPIEYYYNGSKIDIDNVKSDFKINYNSILDEYTLLLSEKPVIKKPPENRKQLIVLDPGLRTFMTGLDEDTYTRLGVKVNYKIRKELNKLHTIKNNPNISKQIKNKYQKRINKNIYNKVDDLHWKIIKYLTTSYNTIFLGDMSAKEIVSNKNSCLNKVVKEAALRTRYYDFRKRLEYKCAITNTGYRLINEMYTSKMCSNCCTYNKKLKGEYIYNCNKCKISIDRDCNGCRNIYMKQYVVDQN